MTQAVAGDRTSRYQLFREISSAATVLATAGIETAHCDAEELAAFLVGTDRGRLALVEGLDEQFGSRYRELVSARACRVPLQHLTGTVAFGPVTLRVGRGVFIPRPETESILEWATAQQLGSRPVIVDVCTGSGALALALSGRWPAARVLGVDDSDTALDYARHNCARTPVELLRADVTTPGLLAELDGRVDLVVANPPYIPDGTVLEPEVAQHDPEHALFGGPDGMRVVSAVTLLAARWLRPGGAFAVEHDETTSSSTIEALSNTAVFDNIVARCDLTGRPRFVTARRRD